MRVRIHRVAHEIGGSCVEVENGPGERLILDMGAPLNTTEGEEPDLPAVEGLTESEPNLKGVLITHAHQDHWGLVDRALPTVPLFMGAATHRRRLRSGCGASHARRRASSSTAVPSI